MAQRQNDLVGTFLWFSLFFKLDVRMLSGVPRCSLFNVNQTTQVNKSVGPTYMYLNIGKQLFKAWLA